MIDFTQDSNYKFIAFRVSQSDAIQLACYDYIRSFQMKRGVVRALGRSSDLKNARSKR